MSYKVESFNLDHTKVEAPYVRLASMKRQNGVVVSKYDIRFCQPNKDCMGTGEIHTLEHLMAETIRDEIGGVIDLSPMGCRTGFYFICYGEYTEYDIYCVFRNVLEKVAVWNKEIPAVNEVECGNYRDHDLNGAKKRASEWLEGTEKKGYRC
ncbi:S-ribosylhomocysteine lyase /quorum-sensing autoinducer 2 (AI-2) synthesis protein LuxS [Treponema bryantii]|uniref:S-ribosylhomocysteine lyase n=1 Tax=Treponema bryantii TaxID=163 RepID=A0A1H9AVN3_9SPIR|nr:S-ribosylhomocysteine lyase [Treponema bryantii]SEP80473.1 S-ribosylhomocysteine lyase /quorum-sensing autoinducer 2 (AI-2) synthesis protein LuxS [Treponema bryantii]